MTLFVADAVGLVGGLLMVVAYGYSNVAPRMNYLLFNLLNLVGSLLLILSLTVAFNLASMLLEVVWALIAAAGLARSLFRARAT